MIMLQESAGHIIALLEAKGIDVFLHEGQASFPGALLVPEAIHAETFRSGMASVTWSVYLVAGDHGVMEALAALDELLAKTIDLALNGEVEPQTLSIGGQTYSALKFSILTQVG